MKKLILAITTVSFLGFSAFAQSDDKKKENLQKLNTTLTEQFQAMGLPEDQAISFAGCLSDKIVNKLTEAEVASLLSADENNPPTEELSKKTEEFAMECMSEMQ